MTAVLALPVTVPYTRFSDRDAHWFLGMALRGLIRGAGVAKERIDGLAVSSFTMAPDTAVGLTQHLGLSPRWLEHVPMGGASAIVALRRAVRAVEAGDAGIVACIAGDTNNATAFREILRGFSRFFRNAAYPVGAGGPNVSFALLTDAYMRAHGATARDFGRICVQQRLNAQTDPTALIRKPLTLEDYLTARPIADPLRMFDCVMPCAGAEGFLVLNEDEARHLGLPFVRVLSSIERHNAFPDDPVQGRGGWAMDRDRLWNGASLGPQDMDLIQTYDDYPVICAMQAEDLGFCPKGEGARFLAARDLTAMGDLPMNTSGGQLSYGQAGAAGGHLALNEALRQLTGQSRSEPVPEARHALVSGFGMINYDRGLCTAATVLEAA